MSRDLHVGWILSHDYYSNVGYFFVLEELCYCIGSISYTLRGFLYLARDEGVVMSALYVIFLYINILSFVSFMQKITNFAYILNQGLILRVAYKRKFIIYFRPYFSAASKMGISPCLKLKRRKKEVLDIYRKRSTTLMF